MKGSVYLDNVKLVGGKREVPILSSEISESEYAFHKVNVWLAMLNNREKPMRWLKPNKKGTGVHFNFIHSQEEYDAGIAELKAYVEQVNEQYNFEFEFE